MSRPNDVGTTADRAHIGTYVLVVLDTQNAGSDAIGIVVKSVVMCV
jgi:hypothetical protein